MIKLEEVTNACKFKFKRVKVDHNKNLLDIERESLMRSNMNKLSGISAKGYRETNISTT